MIKKVLTALMFTVCLHTQAVNYFLSSSGNDLNSGTSIAQAWQSINALNSRNFSAGDSIFLEGGSVFNGNIYFSPTSTGTASQPIYLGSYGSGKATVNAGNSFGFYAYNNQGFSIHNLIFSGSGYNINSQYGILFYCDLPNSVKLKNISISNCEVSGFKSSGIELSAYPSDGSRSGYEHVRIVNCTAAYNGSVGITLVANFKTSDTLYNHRNVQILRSIAHHNYGFANTANHSGNGILIGQVDSGVIAYCEAYENGINNNYPNAGPAGIWTWDSKYIVIEYCYAHHNRSQTVDGDGFDLDGGVRYSILQYNYSHDNDGPGLLVAQFTGARKMEYNIVRYNISENDGRGLGALIWSGDPAGTITTEKIDFYNNCIIIDTIGKSLANAAFAVYNNYGSTKDIKVCNNIFMTRNGANLIDINPCLNLKFYNNSYFDFGNGFKFRDNGITYNTLENWRLASGQEWYKGKKTGFNTNPGLANPGFEGSILNVDSLKQIRAYKLIGGSRLINKGVIVDSLQGMSTLIKDFYGDSIFIQNQFSLGVHDIKMPEPNFSVKDNCNNRLVQFDNRSKKHISSFWKFGDGNVSSLEEPTHIYQQAGTYTVTLITKGKQGYVDSFKRNIKILAEPKAEFTVNNNCLNDTSSFINQSSNAQTFKWTLGNGDSSVSLSPNYRYKSHGQYKIRLIANQSNLCFDSIEKFIDIYPLPIADFKVQNVCLGDSIKAENMSTGFRHVLWNFDGSKDTGLNLTYEFTESKSYNIQLNVTSEEGCKDSTSKAITVHPLPVVKFTAEPVCLYQKTKFNNLSSDSCTYLWIFEVDSSNLKQAEHRFQTAQKHKVDLKAINAFGCKNEYSDSVEVYALPHPNFKYTINNNSIDFAATDSTLNGYEWSIADTIASGKKFNFKPKQNGNYSITLKVKNAQGCDSFMTAEIMFEKVVLQPLHSKQMEISCYPNPFTDNTNINFVLTQNSDVSIEILDAMGKVIHKLNSQTYDAGKHTIIIQSEWIKNNGFYTIKIQTEGSVYTIKVLKI
ncbi:MAG TPA: PKD domain-containing protein [Bacteroidia bacterium]